MKAMIEIEDKHFAELKRALENAEDRDLSDKEALESLFFCENQYNQICDKRECAKIEILKER